MYGIYRFCLRISLSVLLGFFIGLERQLTRHPAGIRINVLICMGTSFYFISNALWFRSRCFDVGQQYFRCWILM